MLGFLLVTGRLGILDAYFSRIFMTDKNILPENQNSKNTSDLLWNEAHELIRRNVRLESGRALSLSASAKSFLSERFSDQETATKYVEGIWQELRDGSRYSQTVMTPDSIERMARELRAEYVKTMATQASVRDSVLQYAEQEYDLSEDQRAALAEKIEGIRSRDLKSFLFAGNRNRLVWDLCRERNEPTPLTIRVATRIRNLFGNTWESLDARTRGIILNADRSGSIGMNALAQIWESLDHEGRKTLLSLCTTRLSLQELYEMDSVRFSKEKLKDAVRTDIQKNISPKIQKLISDSETANIDSILDSLEWSDLADAVIGGDTIIDLVQDGNTELPRGLSKRFQQWLEDHAEVRAIEEERDAEKQQKIKEALEGNEKKIRNIDEAWVNEFEQTIRQKNGSEVSGAELLHSADFLKGEKSLVVHLVAEDGEETISTIWADRTQSEKGVSQVTGFWSVAIDEDGNFMGATEYIPAFMLEYFITEPTHIIIEKRADFFASQGKAEPLTTVEDTSTLPRNDVQAENDADEDADVDDIEAAEAAATNHLADAIDANIEEDDVEDAAPANANAPTRSTNPNAEAELGGLE